MAKLTRVPAKVFAASAAADEIGQFGSAVAGSKLETSDVATIQGLSAWLSGWSEALVSGNRYPALQEMNGLLKVLSYQGAYALQEGIPEYDSATTYYIGSIVKKTGTFELYGSLTDDNVGNALTDNTKWQLLINLADIGGGGVIDFDNKGTVTTNITLAENKITTGYWSGTNTITLPTITDTTKQVTCILDFTTATSSQPTITNTNLRWSKNNNGLAPNLYTTTVTSGAHNQIIAKSIWESGNLYWEIEYTTYGGVETSFTRLNLSSNGTLGGSSFACSSTNISTHSAFNLYDGVINPTIDSVGYSSSSHDDIFYNPNPLKVTQLNITYDTTYTNSYATAGSIYGSNDGTNYTFIISYTNSSYNLIIDLSTNTNFYKYYKNSVTNSNSGGGQYSWTLEVEMTATYIAT